MHVPWFFWNKIIAQQVDKISGKNNTIANLSIESYVSKRGVNKYMCKRFIMSLQTCLGAQYANWMIKHKIVLVRWPLEYSKVCDLPSEI